jgi:hypothetical protein
MWANYMQSYSQTETVQSSNTFKYDKDSGFYLDSQAGLYYDPNSTYFFTTDYKKYFIYDHEVEMLCHVDAEGKKVPDGERRPIPGKEAKSRDRGSGTGDRGSGAARRSRSRSHRVSRTTARFRSPPKARNGEDQRPHPRKAPREPRQDKKGDFKPIYFPGGDPLAKLAAPEPPVSTPKAEPKKKRRPGEVMGLAPMPHKEDLARPGRVTVINKSDWSAPAPGPVQVFGGNLAAFEASVAPAPVPGSLGAPFAQASTLGAVTAPSSMAVPLPIPGGLMPGEFICEVCMRKFSSEEMLRKHEQFSDLHKQNLAKLNGDV